MTSDPNHQESKKSKQDMTGAGVAIGIGVGLALGSAMGNVGAGLAIGIALGAGIGAQSPRGGRETPRRGC